MDLNSLSPELKEKVAECKSSEELMKLAMDEGMELTDEQLEAVAGGDCSGWIDKTDCGVENCNSY